MKKLIFLGCLLVCLRTASAVTVTPLGAEPVLQTGHRGSITDISYSADGRLLASSSNSDMAQEGFGEIKLWDARSGELIRDFVGAASDLNGINSISLSPDGRLLATSGESVLLWSTATGTVQKRLPATQRTSVRAVSFINGGRKVLSVGIDYGQGISTYRSGIVNLWDLASGKVERTLSPGSPDSLDSDTNGKQTIAVARDGSLVAVRTPKGVIMWNTASWQQQIVIPEGGYISSPGGLALSPDKRLLAISNGRWSNVTIFDAATGRALKRIAIGGFAESLLFSADGKTLIGGLFGGGGTGLVRWWNVATGKTIRNLETGEGDDGAGDVEVLVPAPDGKFFALGTEMYSTAIDQRDTSSGKPRVTARAMRRAMADISALAFSRDSKTLAVTQNDGTIRLWRVQPDEVRLHSTYDQYTANKDGVSDVTGIALFGDAAERFVAAGGRNFSLSWWRQGRTKPELVEKTDYPRTLAVSSQGVVACLTTPNDAGAKVLLRDERGQKKGEWGVGEKGIDEPKALAFSPDGQLAVCSSYVDKSAPSDEKKTRIFARITMWETETRKEIRHFDVPQVFDPTSLSFSPDGSLVLLHNWSDYLFVAQTASGKALWDVRDQRGGVFSKDGKTVLCRAANGDIEARDATSGAVLLQRPGGVGARKESDIADEEPAWLQISPDGKMLAGKGEDGSVRLWDAVDGSFIASLLIMPTSAKENHSREWIAWRPNGTFTSSAKAHPFLRWRVGNTLLRTRP